MEKITNGKVKNNTYVQKCSYCGCTYTYTDSDIEISNNGYYSTYFNGTRITTPLQKEIIYCPECGRGEKAKKYKCTPEKIEEIKSSAPLKPETKTNIALIVLIIVMFLIPIIVLGILQPWNV